ncbi:unnamed protein product [Caenorhabditis sp. 36 PRJEB53466]|nr:unnamed protein product [Caenorhabditis sp. 36 PRJEB53466]
MRAVLPLLGAILLLSTAYAIVTNSERPIFERLQCQIRFPDICGCGKPEQSLYEWLDLGHVNGRVDQADQAPSARSLQHMIRSISNVEHEIREQRERLEQLSQKDQLEHTGILDSIESEDLIISKCWPNVHRIGQELEKLAEEGTNEFKQKPVLTERIQEILEGL